MTEPTVQPQPQQRLPQSDWRRHAPAAVRDLRGGLRLVLDGVQRAIDEAQAAQQRLAAVQPRPLRDPPAADPARRWPSHAWHGVRSAADLLGGGVDLALASVQASLLSPRLQRAPEPGRPLRDAVVAALNAVAGDHLQRTDNPLATATELRVQGPPRPRVLVLVHDLGLGAPQWRQQGHDHGEALALACGATPVYLHYNTGRPAADIGGELAAELERLPSGWRGTLAGLALLGHGLGGLVLRSALHQAQRSGMAWPARVQQLVFLGTPLQGGAAPAGARWGLQGAALPRALALLARRTSPGMADFAAGRYLPTGAAWHMQPAPSALSAAEPLPPPAAWHAIAGSIGDGHDDGLVPVDSALARSPAPDGLPALIPPGNAFVARGADHLGLLGSAAAFERMRAWLAP